ncbi:MAG: ABC transporter permease [Phycisphaerales bacterium]|nr:ABC transporter permease [Phycisphaerales bacterium]
MPTKPTKNSRQDEAITGIQAMQGHGVQESPGYWTDVWMQVLRRPRAVAGIVWTAIVAFFAAYTPLLANGHPLIAWVTDAEGNRRTTFPLFVNLGPADWLLLVGVTVSTVWLLLPGKRGRRAANLAVCALQAGLSLVAVIAIASKVRDRNAADWIRSLQADPPLGLDLGTSVSVLTALVVGLFFVALPVMTGFARRVTLCGITATVCALIMAGTWSRPLENFNYLEQIREGRMKAVFTVVPWSPNQQPGDRSAANLPPGSTSETALSSSVMIAAGVLDFNKVFTQDDFDLVAAELAEVPLTADERAALLKRWNTDGGALLAPEGGAVADPASVLNRRTGEAILRRTLNDMGQPYLMGTDSLGRDVMSQMLHACRLAISIGLVSTGIAVTIGVTIGALMGYFGGFVDLLLYRVVEIFMAVPVLFLLIVVAGVLPRNTYVMMAIIGCFTWHGAARFTRAEFLKLRNQDFVQSARSVGLPLRSILFKHMLPNGVTPVLVDASFAIAAAILIEAVLSYLGLGPPDQASWGRLLSDANNSSGEFIWWLAIFPGLAIFLTVLSYNLIGEALQTAIDPKLRKARV